MPETSRNRLSEITLQGQNNFSENGYTGELLGFELLSPLKRLKRYGIFLLRQDLMMVLLLLDLVQGIP